MIVDNPWTWSDGSLLEGFGSLAHSSGLYDFGRKPDAKERKDQFEAKYLKSILTAKLAGEKPPLNIGTNVRPLKVPVVPSQPRGAELEDLSIKTVTHISYFLPHKNGKKMWHICLKGIESMDLPVWFNLENFEVAPPEPLT